MAAESDRIYKERILKVLVHIQRHLDEPLSLEELAGVAHFSPFHFHRVFKAVVGESVMQHVRRLRLECAVQQLVFTDQAVTAIALDAGYETHEGFTRAFKAMFGRSPSSLRTEARNVIHADAPSSVHYRPDAELTDFEPARRQEVCSEIRIETVEPMRVAFVRHLGPYEQCGQAWAKLAAWAGPRGLLTPQTVCVGLAYDDPDITPEDKVRYDACLGVADDVEGAGEVGIQRIDGGPCAMLTHRGSYETLPESIEKLYSWLSRSGREPGPQPLLLFYRNFVERPQPEDMLIDLGLCLAPRR